MSSKRSQRKKLQHFSCVYCGQRLWRQGGPKHYLFDEVNQSLNLSPKFIAAKSVDVKDHFWIEPFLCGEHGKVWLLVSRQADSTLVSTSSEAAIGTSSE